MNDSTMQNTRRGWFAEVFFSVFLFLNVVSSVAQEPPVEPISQSVVPSNAVLSDRPAVLCIGLHGGLFEVLEAASEEAGIEFRYVTDAELARGELPLSGVRAILLEHLRSEDREAIRSAILGTKENSSSIPILALGPASALSMFQDLGSDNPLKTDPELAAYWGNSRENARRFVMAFARKVLGRECRVLPPEPVEKSGWYHPDAPGLFADDVEALNWIRQRSTAVNAPRVLIAVHQTHLTFQQPKVVDALIREFESRGVLAVAAIDMHSKYEEQAKRFAPDLVVHTCHSRETVDFRKELDVPHLHSIFIRSQSIEQWQSNREQGLSSSEQAFQLTSQELLGSIEPQIGAGTLAGGGSAETFTPIPERIDHLADRAMKWIGLRKKSNADKRVAVIYYDREMGKGSVMRGSATGMFMNAPRSMVRLLKRFQKEGYSLSQCPRDEDALMNVLLDQGRQIGAWDPQGIRRIAELGMAELVPTDEYRAWFEEKVPAELRDEVQATWGPPPGRLSVYQQGDASSIVIPRVAFGNVVLLPQPLRGEANDTSLVHDRRVPPTHHYLATYFWLEKKFGADAMIHFGTHGSEFLLPGKQSGLSNYDWSDLILGSLPNLTVWVVNNIGESGPARRRAYAVLINHLSALATRGELSDELLTIHDDLAKWESLEAGPLKESFQRRMSAQILGQNLQQDLELDVENDLLSESQLREVSGYLHSLHEETMPASLHVLGEVPPMSQILPYLVTCLRKPFLDRLRKIAEIENDDHAPEEARRLGEELINDVFTNEWSVEQALSLRSINTSKHPEIVEELQQDFDLAARIRDGLLKTGNEIDAVLAGLDGRFIAPGPGNNPDRNPASVPTGRNLYVLNPEEVPARASWDLGSSLVEGMLENWKQENGEYPNRIAFTMSPFFAYSDYGVMESQILRLIGVRPVWDAQNQVVDVELISREELGRPRIDVFLSVHGYYRDLMPSRVLLIDRAIRKVIELDEPDNHVRLNTLQTRKELAREERQATSDELDLWSTSRMFGPGAGEAGNASYYYLVEKSGEWDSREELANVYQRHNRFLYSKDHWGVEAPAAYRAQMSGTDIVLRNWSDRNRSPSSNKYDWYQGGSLALAIQNVTGKMPKFMLSDVRDPEQSKIITAESALRQDLRVRLFNRKWIDAMMREGYAGADQVSVHVSNIFGWQTMQPDSIDASIWEEVVRVYVRDEKQMRIREWFESENPFALQDLSEILLEAMRKDYWNASQETRQEIAALYANSVLQHGDAGGLRGGGNEKLARFVQATLRQSTDPESIKIANQLQQRTWENGTESRTVSSPSTAGTSVAGVGAGPSAPVDASAIVNPSTTVEPAEVATNRVSSSTPPVGEENATNAVDQPDHSPGLESVSGPVLKTAQALPYPATASSVPSATRWNGAWLQVAGAMVIVMVVFGALRGIWRG